MSLHSHAPSWVQRASLFGRVIALAFAACALVLGSGAGTWRGEATWLVRAVWAEAGTRSELAAERSEVECEEEPSDDNDLDVPGAGSQVCFLPPGSMWTVPGRALVEGTLVFNVYASAAPSRVWTPLQARGPPIS